MIDDPGSGFLTSFQDPHRTPNGKVLIDSHAFISSTTQDASVTINSSNKYTQKFSLSTGVSGKKFEVFLSRNSGEDSIIDCRILNDTGGGLPDTGSVVAEGTVHDLFNKRPAWYTCQFSTSFSLSSSTDYWIELDASGDTEFLWYKDSTVTGVDYTLNDVTLTTDQSLIFKIVSSTDSENRYELPNLMSYSINMADKAGNQTASIQLSNISDIYDEAQPVRHIISRDKEVFVSIGNGITDLTLRTHLVDSFVTGETISTLRTLDKSSKLIDKDVLFKSSFIGSDYSDIIIDLLKQAGLIEGDQLFADEGLLADAGLFADTSTALIQNSGETMPTTGTLSGRLLDAIRKISDAINFEFFFNNEGIPVFSERRTTFPTDYTFDQGIEILRSEISINESKKNMFTRLLAHNGQTSDGASPNTNTATLLKTFSGTVLANERSISLIFSYSTTPVLLAFVENLKTDQETSLKEIIRTVDSITVEVRNNNYPSATGDYEFEIHGSTISNDDAALLIIEKTNTDSVIDNGIIDYNVENDLFDSQTDLNKYVDRLLLLNSNPREFFKVKTRGIPLLENSDIVAFLHDKIDSRFIYKITNQLITFKSGRYDTAYTVEKYPFLAGDSVSSLYLYADDGHVADDGLSADSELTARQSTYV